MIIQRNNFRGDVTDTLAKKAALMTSDFVLSDISVRPPRFTCDDASFYKTTACTWTLATPKTTLESKDNISFQAELNCRPFAC